MYWDGPSFTQAGSMLAHRMRHATGWTGVPATKAPRLKVMTEVWLVVVPGRVVT
jgi:hypothetical protein